MTGTEVSSKKDNKNVLFIKPNPKLLINRQD